MAKINAITTVPQAIAVSTPPKMAMEWIIIKKILEKVAKITIACLAIEGPDFLESQNAMAIAKRSEP